MEAPSRRVVRRPQAAKKGRAYKPPCGRAGLKYFSFLVGRNNEISRVNWKTRLAAWRSLAPLSTARSTIRSLRLVSPSSPGGRPENMTAFYGDGGRDVRNLRNQPTSRGKRPQEGYCHRARFQESTGVAGFAPHFSHLSSSPFCKSGLAGGAIPHVSAKSYR